MNAPLPPQECAWAARVLHGHIDSIAPLRARPGASAWLRRELRELELRALRPVEFVIRCGANDYELERDAAIARVRAERRCGELLTEMDKAKGVRMLGGGSVPVVARDDRREVKTLDQMGITKDQSSKWQRLAAVPEAEFEAAVSQPGMKPTTQAYADGKLIPFTGRGLVIAHRAIDALQQNATLDVAELAPESNRPDNQVREALRRAGVAADRVDHRLGAAIAALAIRRGQIIATSSAVDRVICVAFNSTTSCARDTGATFTTEPRS